jgi:hypothetical protein
MKPAASPLDNKALFFGEWKDTRREGLYDRVLLKAGVPTPREIICFQRSIDQVNSWAETNMMQPGILPAPFDVIVQRFLFLFQPMCSDSDVAAFLRNYVWEFWMEEKRMLRQPVLVCAAKGNMRDLVEGFGQADCNGKIRPYARPYSFCLANAAKYIPPLLSFRLKLIGEPVTPEDDLDFYSIADGTMDVPVQ